MLALAILATIGTVALWWWLVGGDDDPPDRYPEDQLMYE